MKKQSLKQKYFKFVEKLQRRFKKIEIGKIKLISWEDVKKKNQLEEYCECELFQFITVGISKDGKSIAICNTCRKYVKRFMFKKVTDE